MVDISTVGIVSVPKASVLEMCRRYFSEDLSFGIGALLVVERSRKIAPAWCDIHYTVVYGLQDGILPQPVCTVPLRTGTVRCTYYFVLFHRDAFCGLFCDDGLT